MKNKILISTGGLYLYGLDRFFELSTEAGFDGIELVIDNTWDNRQPEYIGRLEQKHKIKVFSVHSAMEFVTSYGKDPKIRFEESAKIAKKIDAKVIVVHPYDSCDRKFYAWIKRNHQEFIEFAKPVKVFFENPTSRRGLKQEKFFKYFPSYTLDTSHAATTQRDLVDVYTENKEGIKHIHLSDSDFAKRINRPDLIDDRHMLPGTGKLPLKKLLHTLKETNYSGYIVIELAPESLEAGESDKIVLKNMRKARDFVRNNLK